MRHPQWRGLLLLLLGLTLPLGIAHADTRLKGDGYEVMVPSDYRPASSKGAQLLRDRAARWLRSLLLIQASPGPGRTLQRGTAAGLADSLIYAGRPDGMRAEVILLLTQQSPQSIEDALSAELEGLGEAVSIETVDSSIARGRGGVLFAIASYMNEDGSQRRLRLAAITEARGMLVLVQDAALGQETLAEAEWSELLRTARVYGSASPTSFWRDNALYLGAVALLLILGVAFLYLRNRKNPWERRERPGLHLDGVSIDDLKPAASVDGMLALDAWDMSVDRAPSRDTVRQPRVHHPSNPPLSPAPVASADAASEGAPGSEALDEVFAAMDEGSLPSADLRSADAPSGAPRMNGSSPAAPHAHAAGPRSSLPDEEDVEEIVTQQARAMADESIIEDAERDASDAIDARSREASASASPPLEPSAQETHASEAEAPPPSSPRRRLPPARAGEGGKRSSREGAARITRNDEYLS